MYEIEPKDIEVGDEVRLNVMTTFPDGGWEVFAVSGTVTEVRDGLVWVYNRVFAVEEIKYAEAKR
jgi:hypothetical protein